MVYSILDNLECIVKVMDEDKKINEENEEIQDNFQKINANKNNIREDFNKKKQ